MPNPEFLAVEEDGVKKVALPPIIILAKPRDEAGVERDQTGDAANHMRYAHSLGLPKLVLQDMKPGVTAIIVGGGHTAKTEIETIKKLAANPENRVFALNWAHTWLIQQGIVPHACVMFEIDVDPCQILENSHPGVTYYICSHCHRQTFDALADRNRVLWHSIPNSPGEKQVFDELFAGEIQVGGGIATFLRTVSVALTLGFRDFALFGVDSSFPDDADSTHVGGYPTPNKIETDAFYVYARDEKTGEQRRFKSVGYLVHQVDEFKKYCSLNHQLFRMRVYGDSLLAFVHRNMWAHQYDEPTSDT